ncbi:uncharacterized protein L3040_005382 [Drepanopeziza brunnea f. sp. 'multigermtubi']|uniref:Uncharacterized protein n=1 Tax=Marssonina brunnea f. sp. multigermtubi (strain MB_m1) TaxID=1072389 RepID=K1WHX0_MARBU|nr:uncharacterized protein MBM_04737 [Drepanopeziza brunnea f. sp. 'multigermtubi' MB_m1]EKD17160.1 hypothetical protein MBM_04737 [Drepanopeziza brunnea f. sp. 'multigermtubi' MB_m1]KAJ5041816.1 hypothetical protein L3040_005382 [Drepanopeziza brunnea f. sp. 'multigermtubi']
MQFINAFFAATTIAIALAREIPAPKPKSTSEFGFEREGQILICEDPDFHKCTNVTYMQDACVGLAPQNLDNVMTSFDTFAYGCEFYNLAMCDKDNTNFVFRGAITDLLTSSYSSFNDQITSFRCGT